MRPKTRGFEVRDLRKENFFVVDNIYLNGLAKHLGPLASAVYFSLCRHADGHQSCFPSQNLIASEHGMGERTVRRAIEKLIECNLVRVERVKSKNGRWLRNRYFLVDRGLWKTPPEATQAA